MWVVAGVEERGCGGVGTDAVSPQQLRCVGVDGVAQGRVGADEDGLELVGCLRPSPNGLSVRGDTWPHLRLGLIEPLITDVRLGDADTPGRLDR